MSPPVPSRRTRAAKRTRTRRRRADPRSAGATALICSVQPAAVLMSWRYIYIVLISALLMLAWALLINNVGRRRYPTYWLSGSTVFVKPLAKVDPEAGAAGLGLGLGLGQGPAGAAAANGGPSEASTTTAAASAYGGGAGGGGGQRSTTDEVMMAAIEGRNDGMQRMVRSLSRERGAADGPAALDGRGDGVQRLVRSLSRGSGGSRKGA